MTKIIGQHEEGCLDIYSCSASEAEDSSGYEQADDLLYEPNSNFSHEPNSRFGSANNSKTSVSSHNMLTVLLDLDNTLIHASLSPDECYDFTVEIEDDERPGRMITVYIKKRPHLEQFLATC